MKTSLNSAACSLLAACCPWSIPSPPPEPKTIIEAALEVKQFIEKEYPDRQHREIADKVNLKWACLAAKVETNLKIDIKTLQYKLNVCRVKLSLRRKVNDKLESMSPEWLNTIRIKPRYQWKILFQLESDATERLKSVITDTMNITVDQFCDDMEEVVESAAVTIRREENFPQFESEAEMVEVLESIGLADGTIQESILALCFHFEKQRINTAYCQSDYKYYFLYFWSLKSHTTQDEICDFLNIYFNNKYIVHIQNITLIQSGNEEEGPQENIQACVRFKKTFVNQQGEEVDMKATLRQIVNEIQDKATTPVSPAKKPFMDKCDDAPSICEG
ncbi:uncharacterized protein LOC135838975 isoform X2 [Planococcus citri]|uniref:uncharacterized protein LOC135838975 isoform X2 n=1 Tax=Planococcus citri TaxID=170843 RepID=UPI0031F936F9